MPAPDTLDIHAKLSGTTALSNYVDMSTMWSNSENHHSEPVFTPFNRYYIYIVIAPVETLLESLLIEIDLGYFKSTPDETVFFHSFPIARSA